MAIEGPLLGVAAEDVEVSLRADLRLQVLRAEVPPGE